MTLRHVADHVWRGGYNDIASWPADDLILGLRIACHTEDDMHLGLSAVFPPDKQQVEQCMLWLAGPRGDGKRILVHCRDGVDRTGIVVTVYLRHVHKWSRARCMRYLIATGFHYGRYWWWLPFIWRLLGHYGRPNR